MSGSTITVLPAKSHDEEVDDEEEPECTSDADCDSGEECTSYGSCKTVTDEGGSGFIVVVIVLFLLIGLGVGGYFAYKKGMLDSVLSKFKKGGGKGPSGYAQPASAYNPYTSKVGQQASSPFGSPGQQPKRPF